MIYVFTHSSIVSMDEDVLETNSGKREALQMFGPSYLLLFCKDAQSMTFHPRVVERTALFSRHHLGSVQ